jgi:hypothetical protein
MPRPTIIATAGPVIIGARRVGSPLRSCAAAAGVPWITVAKWLRRGREAIASGHVSEADKPFADFAVECDRASAQLEQVLRARVLKGTEEDARLALDYVRWLDGERLRKEERRLMRAKARVEEARAAGELVERQRVEGTGVRVYLPEES